MIMCKQLQNMLSYSEYNYSNRPIYPDIDWQSPGQQAHLSANSIKFGQRSQLLCA